MKAETDIFCYILLIQDTDLISYQLSLERNLPNPIRYKEIILVHKCKSFFFTFYPNAIWIKSKKEIKIFVCTRLK